MARFEWLMIFLGGITVGYIQHHFPQPKLKESIVFSFNDQSVTFPAEVLKFSSFGYGHSLAAVLWIRFLQQTPPKKIDVDQLSWIYHDLNSITELDPAFYPAYEEGAIFLSVVTEDKRGAERIFLKGIQAYPNRWRIRAYLAYHYDWELKDPEKAAEQYLAGGSMPGAPAILKVRAGSALARKNGNQAAISLLESFLKETSEPEARKRIIEKIRKLKGDKS